MKFWVTFEFKPGWQRWTPAEGIFEPHRHYRIILQQDYMLPQKLVTQLPALLFVERIAELTTGETNLPCYEAVSLVQMVQSDATALIHLAYAKGFTRGHVEVKIAVLDTGVNLAHKKLHDTLGPTPIL